MKLMTCQQRLKILQQQDDLAKANRKNWGGDKADAPKKVGFNPTHDDGELAAKKPNGGEKQKSSLEANMIASEVETTKGVKELKTKFNN
jgi:hypothetical protein